MTLAVKVALNPNTTNQNIELFCNEYIKLLWIKKAQFIARNTMLLFTIMLDFILTFSHLMALVIWLARKSLFKPIEWLDIE